MPSKQRKGRVSKFLGINRSQAEIDFVDIDIFGDIPLYINPGALRKSDSEWSDRCAQLMQDFMHTVLQHIKVGDTEKARELLSYLGEPNETHLGQTAAGKAAQGHAVGFELASIIIDAIERTPAGRSGLIVDLEDTVMMIPNIGSDVISDMTTNIIRGPLIEYTNEMCLLYDVDTEAFKPRRDQPIWSLDTHEWEQPEVILPVANGKPLILVPKWIVRKQVNANTYFRDYLQPYIAQRELENPNSEFVRLLKNKSTKPNIAKIQERYGTKSAALKLLTTDPELYGQYRNAVTAGDPRKPKGNSVMEAVGAEEADYDAILDEVLIIPAGADTATLYERAVDRLFSALFTPELRYPRRQQPQNAGQKRLDLLWTNAAETGFFFWIKSQCNASYVISEYKNYGSEVANPEFDQLAMRFGKSKGEFGFLVCRKIVNRPAAIQRAREVRVEGRGFIIALDDEDLKLLVQARKIGADAIFEFLVGRVTQIAQ